MTTNNTRKLFVSLFIIALFAIMLSACSPAQLVVAAAGDTGSDPAYAMNVRMSPRIEGCSMSATQQILNQANALSDAAKDTTVDAFLSNLMPRFSCITEK